MVEEELAMSNKQENQLQFLQPAHNELYLNELYIVFSYSRD